MTTHPEVPQEQEELPEKECPICHRVWTISRWDDYLLPACGCYGTDHGERLIPCEHCGIQHMFREHPMPAPCSVPAFIEAQREEA